MLAATCQLLLTSKGVVSDTCVHDDRTIRRQFARRRAHVLARLSAFLVSARSAVMMST